MIHTSRDTCRCRGLFVFVPQASAVSPYQPGTTTSTKFFLNFFNAKSGRKREPAPENFQRKERGQMPKNGEKSPKNGENGQKRQKRPKRDQAKTGQNQEPGQTRQSEYPNLKKRK